MNERTSLPGVTMITVGLVIAVMAVVQLGFLWLGVVANVGLTAVGGQGSQSDVMLILAMQGITLTLGTVLDVLSFVQGAVIAFGGVQLRALGSRTMVLTGAILCVLQPMFTLFTGAFGGCGICACLPMLAFSLVSLFVGIWAITAMNDPEVVAAWEGIGEPPPPVF